jgi:uncharacterized protein
MRVSPTSLGPAERVRAFGYFVIAAIYVLFAQLVAARAASGLSSGAWLQPIERAILLFLLLVGFGAMGRAFERQHHPLRAMGLVSRPGASGEFGLGAAFGWGMVVISILPMVFSGGLIVSFFTTPRQFGLLFLDLLTLALASLAEEVAFRGYPFQRLIEAIGPVLATLLLSVLFGLAHVFNPNVTSTSVVVTIFAGWLLSIAYLFTRALWFSWGWHFAWNVSICALFGLPLSGITSFSPVVQSNTIGPRWMTGGNYGPEGSVVAAVVLLVGAVAIYRATRGYASKYAQPVVPAGKPADFDAAGHFDIAAQGGMSGNSPEAPPRENLVEISPNSDQEPHSGENPTAASDLGLARSPDPRVGEG